MAPPRPPDERDLPQVGIHSHRPRPDAVLTWREGTPRSLLALEYDTGTERLARLVEKIDRYATLSTLVRHDRGSYEFDDLFNPHDPNAPLKPREPRDSHDPPRDRGPRCAAPRPDHRPDRGHRALSRPRPCGSR
ncbi:replication-relaxation family protein [Embleya sp. NPDC020886]|uniref:replication-relaxation family protein n=1 Tax=Embleya sp. NPDC020886 TaxID=3363980 RepID=UPI0037B59C7B